MKTVHIITLSLLFTMTLGAVPVQTNCGPDISFTYDDSIWAMKSPASTETGRKSYELTLTLKNDPGEKLSLWTIRRNPREMWNMKKLTPARVLEHMVNMVSRKNAAPRIPQTERYGKVTYACVLSKGTGGQPFTLYIGSIEKGEFLAYLMLVHEPHRSGGKQADRAALKERFLAIVRTLTLR